MKGNLTNSTSNSRSFVTVFKHAHLVLFALAVTSQLQITQGRAVASSNAKATANLKSSLVDDHGHIVRDHYRHASNETTPVLTNNKTNVGGTAAASMGVITISHKDFEQIFMRYDRQEDDAPECSPDAEAIGFSHQLLCPHDLRVACGELSAIENHCAALLGSKIMSRYASGEVSKDSRNGLNAYSGCINYVSYHIWEPHEHFGCCESDFCDDWHDKRSLEIYYNEQEDYSFDDDFIPTDDDEYHTEF